MTGPRFLPTGEVQQCTFCLALIPRRAVRCAYCGSEVESYLPGHVGQLMNDLATLKGQWRRLRWGAAFFFGSTAVLAGGALGAHVGEVVGSGRELNLSFTIGSSAAFLISVLLVILTSPGPENPTP